MQTESAETAHVTEVVARVLAAHLTVRDGSADQTRRAAKAVDRAVAVRRAAMENALEGVAVRARRPVVDVALQTRSCVSLGTPRIFAAPVAKLARDVST